MPDSLNEANIQTAPIRTSVMRKLKSVVCSGADVTLNCELPQGLSLSSLFVPHTSPRWFHLLPLFQEPSTS